MSDETDDFLTTWSDQEKIDAIPTSDLSPDGSQRWYQSAKRYFLGPLDPREIGNTNPIE